MGLDSLRSGRFFSLLLDDIGDGSGNTNAAVDGTEPVVFKHVCAPNMLMHVYRIIIMIQDDGVHAAEKYGSLATLANGVGLSATIDGSVLNLTPVKVKSNAQWAMYCLDDNYHSTGTGDSFWVIRWTFAKGGTYLPLHAGEDFSVTINDNLSTLTQQTFSIQGTIHALDGQPYPSVITDGQS